MNEAGPPAAVPRGSRSPGRWRRHDDVVSVEAPEALVLVRARDGIVDLREAIALSGSARRIWMSLAESDATLDAESRTSDTDLEAFLTALRLRGFVTANEDATAPGPGVAAAPPGAPSPAAAAREGAFAPGACVVGSEGLSALARAVLERGFRLRFQARGGSMRPQVPDGAILEVKPAGLEDAPRAAILVYGTDAHRLVAHRRVGRRGEALLARGDSAGRVDEVSADRMLGVAVARWEPDGKGGERRVPLDGAFRRAAGRTSGVLHRALASVARVVVVAPLRASTLLRRAVAGVARLGSAVLRRVEDACFRMRRGVDTVRAGLTTPDEKDRERRRLYARRATRAFTALDENLEAGLTLIEEVLLARHPLPPDARLLVLGCGPGRECVALAERGSTVVGLDRDEAMLAHARALSSARGVPIHFVSGEATAFDLPGERFDAVIAWSGLYNMVLPRSRRIALLSCARRHLAPGGCVLITFLSDYVAAGTPPPAPRSTLLSAIQPEHERGDRFLLNECIHILPHPDEIAAEAAGAGLEVAQLWRDQRAYDRARGQVRGYAILREPRAP